MEHEQKPSVSKLPFFTAEVTQEEYPYRIPPRPQNPRQLEIDDLERVTRFKKLYGGCVCDALFLNGIVNTILDHGLRPLREHDVIAGRCLPIKWHSLAPEIHLTEEEKRRRAEQWEREGSPQKRMHASVFPGSVLVFDTGGDMQAAQFGEMSCTLAKSRGCVGIVNDGMTRDSKYILRITDFPYFSRGTTPNAYGGWRVIDVNVPIYIRGHLTHYVMVCPGDFIFGDDDGLQIIPKDYVDEVLLKAEEIFEFEEKEREMIRNGMPIDEVYKMFGDL
ncbi:dimethylmenaquinone methyltransferase [Candidatus Vecturithrix granuli]|uniref:Regulator of ribonuclease activity homolog n=1 Tax=Vecturithrix granuli TaxID=1499967 RepID=A0A081C083_VECG1|nr:dimethylmenaquinone methyltransferase [Candidatus Vecturithrix granuli]